jgi:hypothetical protein
VVIVGVVGPYNRRRKIVEVNDALGGIRDVFAGSEHGKAPEKEGSMGSIDAITVLVYPASEALLQCPKNSNFSHLSLSHKIKSLTVPGLRRSLERKQL